MSQSGRRRPLEQQIAELDTLRADPNSAQTRAALSRALESSRSPLVAAAAELIAELELDGFEPALSAAFERWIEQPAKADANCMAKTSAVRALYRLGAKTHGVYLRGIRHREGGPHASDPAAPLRGLCALALVRSGYFDALVEAAELLADREPQVRAAAAQAIAYSERQDVGVPLLRLKARLGDEEPQVIAACLFGLLSLAPAGSLEFVANMVQSGAPEFREAALLALGESRVVGALPILQRAAEDPLASEQRGIAFIAIALLRSDAAWDYLLRVVAEDPIGKASEALSALATYRSDENLSRRALDAVRERGERSLLTQAMRAFQRDA